MSTDFSLPTAAVSQANHLPHSVMTLPFVLGFAGRWEPGTDGKLRPVMVPFQLRPGLHSIGEMSKDFRAQFSRLRASAERRGYVIVDPSDGPAELGGPVHSFDAWEPERRAAVVCWKVKWETPKAGPINAGRVSVDYAILDQFLAHWAGKGIIPAAPDEAFIERALHDADRKHSAKLEKDPTGRSYSAHKAAADLKTWQTIADRQSEGAAASSPAPAAPVVVKPKPKGKAKLEAGMSLSLDAPVPNPDDASGME